MEIVTYLILKGKEFWKYETKPKFLKVKLI